MAVQKKVPMRQCTGCREMKPKRELIRVVKSPEGEIAIDFKGKNPGRGAYVCRNLDCLEKAAKQKAVRLPAQLVEELREEIMGGQS